MSQMRAMGVELRAILAAVAACALVFSLLVSGAVTGASGATLYAGGYAAVGCHHSQRNASVPGTASSKPSGGKTGHIPGHIHCPDCCLATQAASAVLPERLATIARPTPAAERARYSAFSSREPNTADPNAANRARAPPAASSIS